MYLKINVNIHTRVLSRIMLSGLRAWQKDTVSIKLIGTTCLQSDASPFSRSDKLDSLTNTSSPSGGQPRERIALVDLHSRSPCSEKKSDCEPHGNLCWSFQLSLIRSHLCVYRRFNGFKALGFIRGSKYNLGQRKDWRYYNLIVLILIWYNFNM